MSASGNRPQSPRRRKFFEVPAQELDELEDERNGGSGSKTQQGAEIASLIRSSVIGSDASFSGPFGVRPVVYCDYVASGRSVSFIEDFIRAEVLPLYSNTHTTTTVTSMQTTMFRHEARDVLRNAVNASEHDSVIFAGTGCTGAVHKLIDALGIRDDDDEIAVIVSEMEHHSNLLPWRDIANAEVFVAESDEVGRVDAAKLDELLTELRKRTGRIIGCFCAASNVTGILNDDLAITAVLHSHGAAAFWDYATAAPYVNIDVNPKVPGLDSKVFEKDAVFFSVHKFVGGVQTPGVLVAKKRLFKSDRPPNGAGGGSVFFVGREGHRYLQDTEMREEGGTPAIVEAVRAGMAVQLKEAACGSGFIGERDDALMRRVRGWMVDGRLGKNFVLLGHSQLPRLPVLSFLVRHPETGSFLHHNFVCAVLNDLFGVQARGGCACAGPYAQSLVGISPELAAEYENILKEDDRLDRTHLRRGQSEYSSYEVLRPGFTRLNLPWFASDEEIDFVLEAVALTCELAWKLMPQYRFNNETGEWKHFDNLEYRERKWLGNISYASGKFEFRQKNSASRRDLDFKGVLSEARSVLEEAKKRAAKRQVSDQRILFGEGQAKKLRWFLLPFEARQILCSGETIAVEPPFRPLEYPDDRTLIKSVGDVGSYGRHYSVDEQISSLRHRNPGEASRNLDASKTKESVAKAKIKAKAKTKADTKHPEKNNSDIKMESGAENGTPTCDSGLCVLSGERGPPQTVHAKGGGWRSPPTSLFRPFLEAVEEFKMIGDGDRVLVCLSGGKDSLSLLHALRQYKFYAKNALGVSFDLGALTVDPRSSAYDPRPLIPYLASLGVEYLYEEQAIMAQALAADASSICSFCSRLKRGRIYAAARREGYNVLAMGQHLDDLAESFLMSVFHNGRLRTMKANYSVKEEDLRVIRPFVYVREKQLREFAEREGLPVIPENCPACFESPKERHRTKQLLAQQELLFPRLYWSLRSAMMPVMSVNRTGVESALFGSKRRTGGDDDEEEEGEEDDQGGNASPV